MKQLKAATQATHAARLAEKFRPKTYFESMRTVFHVIYGTSFLFNTLSAATASALIYFFLAPLMPAPAAVVLTAAVLFALEATKRMTASKLFQSLVTAKGTDALAVVVVVVLSGASIASSFKGAENIVIEYTPPAAQPDRSRLNELQANLADIDKQIQDQKRNTWKGRLTVPAARTVEQLTKQRAKAQEMYLNEMAAVSTTAGTIEAEHKQTTHSKAHLFALFTLACELLFLAAAYWIEYYDYRSHVELSRPAPDAPEVEYTAPAQAPAQAMAQAQAPAPKEYRINVQPGRQCAQCGAGYEARHNKQKYCSDKCRLSNWHQRNGRPVSRNGVG